MLLDIVDALALPGHQLHVRFEDGTEGTVDLTKLIEFDGVFAPIRNREFFDQVRVDPELGTVVWPNGADLDPDVLYAEISGQPLHIGPQATNP